MPSPNDRYRPPAVDARHLLLYCLVRQFARHLLKLNAVANLLAAGVFAVRLNMKEPLDAGPERVHLQGGEFHAVPRGTLTACVLRLSLM